MTRHYAVYDRDGRRVDDDDAFDERGVIRDGFGLRVPLVLMDSTQRRIAADVKRRKVVERDPMGRVRSTFEEEEEEDAMTTDAQLALHRPGYRTSTRVNDDAAVEAYRQYVADQANAWRKRDAPVGAYPLSAGEGNACTIDGCAGTLQRRGDALVCVPTTTNNSDAVPAGPVYDRAAGERLKQEAWQRMVDDQRQAWRKR